MGEKTGIAWTDHTFNPWIGCTKVSAGCENCYAARDNNRYGWVREWGKDYRLTSDANWKKPVQWAKKAVADGVTRRVFCASLADVFDEKVSEQWRTDLVDLILDTEEIGGLEWLILTKRPENISKMFRGMARATNIRIGITCENNEMARLRMPVFLDSWQGKNFISWEPALSPITDNVPFTDNLIDWIIAGCESGPGARPCSIDWIRDMRDECIQAKTPFFLKQLVVDGQLVKMPELDGRVWNEFPEEK